MLARGTVPFDVGCPLLASTGVPCPFCGITRLTDHLVHGDVALAVTTDPFGVLLVGLVGLLAIAGIAVLLGRASSLSRHRAIAALPVGGTLLGALALHWTTTLLGGGFVEG
ncbi:MAG: DUF2752 domain-containing protein [Acidimicrobiales bacterium]|nr:DUF2752 domain-containing protein [Acidimicrobiales bacterium]